MTHNYKPSEACDAQLRNSAYYVSYYLLEAYYISLIKRQYFHTQCGTLLRYFSRIDLIFYIFHFKWFSLSEILSAIYSITLNHPIITTTSTISAPTADGPIHISLARPYAAVTHIGRVTEETAFLG